MRKSALWFAIANAAAQQFSRSKLGGMFGRFDGGCWDKVVPPEIRRKYKRSGSSSSRRARRRK